MAVKLSPAAKGHVTEKVRQARLSRPKIAAKTGVPLEQIKSLDGLTAAQLKALCAEIGADYTSVRSVL